MTKKELQKAVEARKVPKDGLSNPWDLAVGMILVATMYYGVVSALFSTHGNSMYTLSPIVFTGTGPFVFVMANVLLGLAIYYLINDRKLKSIWTGVSKEQNRLLVIDTLQRIGWDYKEYSSGAFHVDIPLVFGARGHKLTIIVLDQEVLFNIRNVGTSRGRLPFLFGIDTLKELRFKRELNEAILAAGS
jgi:hypothetical protein